MRKTEIKDIAAAINGSVASEPRNRETKVSEICIDSRKVKAEDLFFAIVGENRDGHIFLDDVIASGCHTIVASRDNGFDRSAMEGKGIGLILVSDTTEALQRLAECYISSLPVKKIGVTGSVGKTTTKEMLYSVFSEKYKTFRNEGNLNNHIGLPLSVLAMDENMEVGIFEMGMSEFGEIDLLARIVKPDIGIITMIGTSHIENLKSREGILKAKLEITDFFNEKNVLIVNSDNDMLDLEKRTGSYKILKVGTKGKNDFILSNIVDKGEAGVDFSMEWQGRLQNFTMGIPGRHNAYNGALAAAAALECGMDLSAAAKGLSKVVLTDKRLSIKGKNGMKVIDDTYNASPESMKAAIDVLSATKGLRKIAILGDMLEMGDESDRFHLEIGEYVGRSNVGLLYCIGEAAGHMARGAAEFMDSEKIKCAETKEKLWDEILREASAGDVILVKGSRGMEMDKIVRKIMEKE